MVRLSGIEPETHCLEGSCSIQLSYRRADLVKGNNRGRKTGCCYPMPLVGAVRFELTAPWSQTKCATAALRPD